MAKKRDHLRGPIGWERVRAIFNWPRPPVTVWERQFDYCDDGLQRLARTPYEEIDFSDLWYYFHDLAYVELQPDLFDYLFPVCLMDWHRSLMGDEICGHGDADFHRGLQHGRVLEKMLTPERREAVHEFFRDSFLERLDTERGFFCSRNELDPFAWIRRFNTLGIIMPRIDLVWESWWSLETPGRAVAALEYVSGLMDYQGDHPLLPERLNGYFRFFLWMNDAAWCDPIWMSNNLDYLRSTLTAEFVEDGVSRAVARLRGEPEEGQALQIEHDLIDRRDLVVIRIEDLLGLLSNPDSGGWWGD